MVSGENDFLNELTKMEIAVTVFLLNGTKLQGILSDFDDNALFLRRDNHTQLIYKHAVSTIMPSIAVQMKKNG